jgi:hypothetical protein
MNIAELRPSDEAPNSWKRSDSQETVIAAAFRQQLLLLLLLGARTSSSSSSSSKDPPPPPHFIFLQECPRERNAAWITDTLLSSSSDGGTGNSSSDYVSMGTRPSHAGFVTLLVRRDFLVHQKQQEHGSSGRGNKNSDSTRSRTTSCTLEPLQVSEDIPAVAAKLSFWNNGVDDDENHHHERHSDEPPSLVLILASVHLAPFESGASHRRFQMQQLLQLQSNVQETTTIAAAASSNNSNNNNNNKTRVVLLVAGDTNMRDSEDVVMQDELHFQDAWKLAGSNLTTQFTWDTTVQNCLPSSTNSTTNNTNSNRDGMTTPPPPRTIQNLYYGQRTRAYQRRYDRIYIHNGHTAIHDDHQQHQRHHQQQQQQQDDLFSVKVHSFELLANKPIEPSRFHFLSDHFGMAADLEFSW